jgi:hypothetical protein
MMEAIHLELLPQMLEYAKEETHEDGRKTGDKEISAATGEFRQELMRAGYDCPTGAASSTDSRFRLFLKIPGQPEFNGVYYVSRYRDSGHVSLSWDPDQVHIIPRRREAIMATRAKAKVIL